MKLADLQILALDCQTTGANPARGNLLEIGWVKTRASADPSTLTVEAHFVRLAPDVDISPAVKRVTGLSEELLENGLPAADIWQQVVADARKIAAADRLQCCPAVIHYARFEKAFLKHLHAEKQPDVDFPLRFVCSHEIARRLLPGLPRKGLRAVAGYFGHSVPPLRRAADHAVATAVIWRCLVQLLKSGHGIESLDQLTDWLKCTPAPGRTKRMYPMKPDVRRRLPDGPGIYRMRRSNGDLLYIGKATSLKQRVNSYFRQKGAQAEHTLEMLSQAADLDVTQTGSALEAAVLESDEIKAFAPPYNVALQKGERRLVFGSIDLQTTAATPDAAHCIGPLPDGNLPATLKALGTWCAGSHVRAGDDLQQFGTTILRMPPADAPSLDCLSEGLTLFHSRHRIVCEQPHPLRFLLRLGTALWRQHLVELQRASSLPPEEEIAAEEKDGDPALENRQGPIWTPEAIVRGLERRIMHGALLIRRARWLCLLSESTLAWQVRGSSDDAMNVLVFAAGAVSRCAQLQSNQKTPPPPGYILRMPQRQKHFDVDTYDRLRVVTTELRRLVAEGRCLEMRLKPNAALSHRHLARLLPWV